MKKMTLLLALIASLALFLTACSEDPVAPTAAIDGPQADKADGLRITDPSGRNRGVVVVANRASGTISVIDAKAGQLVGTHDLPPGEATPEPMYVVSVGAQKRVFVGDRANDRVVVFDARNFAVVGSVPAGQGVFHMWADPSGHQLWVNNDIDNTITVIAPRTLEVLATVPVPADLVAMGGKPHDVILDAQGHHAFVTILGIDGPSDYLVQFDTADFSEIARATVGKDPHLSIGASTDLYVPCQNSDQVLVFDPETLALVDEIAVPGAHGAVMANNGRYFYTTNLPGGGAGALYTVTTQDNQVAGDPVDTPYPVPHNLTITPNGKRLFVTHSGGTADKVTFYELVGPDREPIFTGELTVGLNPFGLAYVK